MNLAGTLTFPLTPPPPARYTEGAMDTTQATELLARLHTIRAALPWIMLIPAAAGLQAVTCRIFGVLYHGWYMESSGDYCRLKKAKKQEVR